MIAPEDPPGFVVRTAAQKAAWDTGFRLQRVAQHLVGSLCISLPIVW
jgi:hypothetical protein